MSQDGWEADVRASQLEIYNDTVRDLLDAGTMTAGGRGRECSRDVLTIKTRYTVSGWSGATQMCMVSIFCQASLSSTFERLMASLPYRR